MIVDPLNVRQSTIQIKNRADIQRNQEIKIPYTSEHPNPH